MDDIYVGKFLDQRYEILERIGTGGMAVVYKGLDHRLNRLVAIKILKADLAQNDELRRRFHAEGQAVAMLSHPNIVAVYDVNRKENLDYIVMELIEGITLKQYINRKGILNWKEALHFSTQIAKALGHAHSRGIVHRDIKPQNIMVLKDGSVKVADFGIARLLATQNTLTQEALGSVHYISPEQAKGQQVDARSDIYSLGVVMYEMLTSRLPFEGESAVAIAIQHISSVPLQPREINPDIPKGLAQITMHAMEPNLDLRYKTADELLRDLEEFRKNPSVEFTYSSVPGEDTDVDGSHIVPGTKAPSNVKRGSGNSVARDRTTKDEYRKNRRKSGTTAMLIGIFLVIVLVIGIGVYVWRSFGKDIFNPSEERIQVPSFVDSIVDDVVNNPENSAFNFTIRETESETVPAGVIISQDPKADRAVTPSEEGINVVLTVSTGPRVVTMPDII
ncbi:MAG: Stk1 family PASTA domain-containing Ser/Thr kinase, partial [Oscillospiraceae bacterium]|nr:Stk1 family PASTA domain-containing Ser/Thr kinase [Oscillospiraceae bacterium]